MSIWSYQFIVPINESIIHIAIHTSQFFSREFILSISKAEEDIQNKEESKQIWENYIKFVRGILPANGHAPITNAEAYQLFSWKCR